MNRTDDTPAISQRRLRDGAGYSKVRNLRVPVLSHQDIVRLNVAMNNVIGVRVGQTAGNVLGNARSRQQVKRSFVLHFLLKRVALHVLHNDIVVIARNANIVNADNVWVRKPSRRLSLAVKTLYELHVRTIFRVEDFYCHGTS